MSANPSALLRLWDEFSDEEPDVVFGGIYANKSGYHNTRNNHLRDSPGDYSIQTIADRRGAGDKAAAIDLTFRSAQGSDFRTIAKYSQRLLKAFRGRDDRLFHNGNAVVREFFGNTDLDREVEGWSLFRGYAVSSDPSHVWHIHISFHRQFVENWEAVRGVLLVLLDQEEDMPLNADDKQWLRTAIKEEVEEALTKKRALGTTQQELTGQTERSLVQTSAGGWAQAFLAAENTSDEAVRAVSEE